MSAMLGRVPEIWGGSDGQIGFRYIGVGRSAILSV
jgi:hypothetical protein